MSNYLFQYLEYLPIIIPGLLGYGTSMLCGIQSNSGVIVSIRPPPIIFMIVWPILYIMLGLSWYYSRKIKTLLTDIFYGLLVFLLSLWIIIYSCQNNKIGGVYILMLSIVFSLLSYTIGDLTSQLLIVPLIGWLLFATLLNIFEVQLQN